LIRFNSISHSRAISQTNKQTHKQAVLIANPHSEHKDIIALMKRRIDGYITSTLYVMIMYNVHRDLLDAAVQITPGKRSPTITSLDDGDYKAVSSLVKKDEISEKMDLLHDAGATDILVMQLANSRM
jgi:ATP phosphoribosyltransferase